MLATAPEPGRLPRRVLVLGGHAGGRQEEDWGALQRLQGAAGVYALVVWLVYLAISMHARALGRLSCCTALNSADQPCLHLPMSPLGNSCHREGVPGSSVPAPVHAGGPHATPGLWQQPGAGWLHQGRRHLV